MFHLKPTCRTASRADGRTALAMGVMAVVLSVSLRAAESTPAPAQGYPDRAEISKYLMTSQEAEIRLARSAAPASVSDKADVMVLGEQGYRTVVPGTNGFTCMVWRSWSDDLEDAQFWNWKVRAPICLNSIAVRTVLPDYLRRTEWVLAGVSRTDIVSRFKAAAAKGELLAPAAGAMSYMMSKDGNLADGVGHAAPHIMFFVPRDEHQDWGANLPASPIWGAESALDPVTVFFVTVPKWSDGTLAVAH